MSHGCKYEYDEGNLRLKIECQDCLRGRNIEDCGECMAAVVNKLMEIKQLPRLVMVAEREYEYNFDEVRMLFEIA
ncbi:MAG: hypothetical protein ABIA21_01795, partial [Candidatus Aenigmatarchaeota archaeon]